MQGAIFQGNLIEVALNCRHWRTTFPHAQIVLSISVSDVLDVPRQDRQPCRLKLAKIHEHDGHLQIAIDEITRCCDIVTLANGELPLPPIKNDSPKLNNMNHQIVAAQNGLALASSTYVLRVRHDLVFLDRSFIDQYEASEALPRGKAGVLQRRVMVSWLYTLNPYTVERMPLHISDWFHFGLLEDVRRLWDVPRVTLTDAVYYRTRPHAPESNKREKQFNIRLGVEQHLAYHAFKADFPDLHLAYNNDLRSVDLAMDILIDNFVVCDLAEAHCFFDKYAYEFADPEKALHCITRTDWLAMVRARDVPYTVTLANKIKAVSRVAATAEGGDFPKVFNAFHLRLGSKSTLVDGEIVATRPQGLVFFGPYTTLPRGEYVALVSASALNGTGAVTLRVTCDTGETLLAKRRVEVNGQRDAEWRVPFAVRKAEAVKLEVQCHCEGELDITISSVTLARRAASTTERLLHRLLPSG